MGDGCTSVNVVSNDNVVVRFQNINQGTINRFLTLACVTTSKRIWALQVSFHVKQYSVYVQNMVLDFHCLV